MIDKYHNSLSEHGFDPRFFSVTLLILILDWIMIGVYGFNVIVNSRSFSIFYWKIVIFSIFPINILLNVLMFVRSLHAIIISGISVADYPKFLITDLSLLAIISMICALIFMGSVSGIKATR